MKFKEAMKSFWGKLRAFSFVKLFEKMENNLGLMIGTCITTVIIMALVAAAVFFVNVQGYEQVLVPNVVGKSLEDALLEMQAKELYPKINLRYSDVPGDEGTIMEQSPASGAIVKGYSRVSLVVSRGIIVDSVGNYVGQDLDAVRLKLQEVFAGQTRPLIVLAEPEYKADTSEPGTILEQDPPEGTSISTPVTVHLIVSRGPNYDNTKPPVLKGSSINDIYQTISRSKMIFDFTSHIALEEEIPGTVTSCQTFNSEFVPIYTHMTVEMAMPDSPVNDLAYGIFENQLPDYPYPINMRLDARSEDGSTYTLLNFVHTGGSLTLPYAVARNTTLVLYQGEKIVDRYLVQ